MLFINTSLPVFPVLRYIKRHLKNSKVSWLQTKVYFIQIYSLYSTNFKTRKYSYALTLRKRWTKLPIRFPFNAVIALFSITRKITNLKDDINIKVTKIEENKNRSSEDILSYLQKIDARLCDIESKFKESIQKEHVPKELSVRMPINFDM